MDALEYAIRPYQTPNSQGKIIIPSTPGATTARATITWGAKNSVMPKAQVYGGGTCCGEKNVEQKRDGDVIRIFGNDDPGDGSGPSYVDVFRTNDMWLGKSSASTCDGQFDQYLALEFAPFGGLGQSRAADGGWVSDDSGDGSEGGCQAKFEYNYSDVTGA